MISLDPPNYAPTDAEVETTRKVLEFARHDAINAMTGARGRADLEDIPDLVYLVDMIVDEVNHALEWSDRMVLRAVERYDARTDSRPGKEQEEPMICSTCKHYDFHAVGTGHCEANNRKLVNMDCPACPVYAPTASTEEEPDGKETGG